MGQKVNPHGLRVGVISDWESNCNLGAQKIYTIKSFDKEKKEYVIHPATPGFLIGQRGSEIENLNKELLKVLDRKVALDIKIMDIKNPDKHAQLVAENIAQQLENSIY